MDGKFARIAIVLVLAFVMLFVWWIFYVEIIIQNNTSGAFAKQQHFGFKPN